MYAVIETGGKQYRVEQGDVIDVERIAGAGEGSDAITFDRVLMIGGDAPRVGQPTVAGAQVTGRLVEPVRGPKIRVFKKKRRKGYKRLNGHRQDLLRVRIDRIEA
ncbi:MAG: 50S ribosomal protein L21 [Acidobacteriota bacterium]|nr:50S ribosomal protein L21 [Acidobacteriota bacterium]